MKISHLVTAFLMLVSTAVFAVQPVNINTADVQTLSDSIKGIGPSKAQAIVTYRTNNGPFQDINDLALVKGIGAKTVQKNKDNLTLGKSDTDKSVRP